jgi:hypothetical protein
MQSMWIIGDWQEPVFEEAVGWLRFHADCQYFDSPDAASDKGPGASDGRYPRAIVFVQSRPGQFSAQQVEKVHAKEPLARLIALTGPWCEGEMRSGRPPAGVVRIPWRNWRERLATELSSDEPLPAPVRTMTETDRIEAVARRRQDSFHEHGVAEIRTARLAAYDQIADAVRQVGLVPLTFERNGDSAPAQVVMCDGWDQVPAEKNAERNGKSQSLAAMIVLLHFPRPEDHARARQAGIAAVLGQPLLVADLSAALCHRVHG